MKNKDFLPRPQKSDFHKCLGFLGNLFFCYCVIIAVALILFSSVTVECMVSGDSMLPTFNLNKKYGNDIVYVNKFDRDFEFGDIIVINIEGETYPIIKRVIGVEGDIIDIVKTDGGQYRLEVNGNVLEEDYLNINYEISDINLQDGNYKCYNRFHNILKNEHSELFENGKLVVGRGEVFAMGDNRHVSQDSTYYGNFETSDILGTVERSRRGDEKDFDFYYDYIITGEFLKTINNCFD